MIEADTIKLLRECDAGIQMGVSAIGEVLDSVGNPDFRHSLFQCKAEHEQLKTEIQKLLNRYRDDGKAPDPMAKGMSWIKTHAKLTLNGSDNTVADLITDGCNMGVKSLSRYLNQYAAADETSKDIAKRLICLESDLAVDARDYL